MPTVGVVLYLQPVLHLYSGIHMRHIKLCYSIVRIASQGVKNTYFFILLP